MNQLWIKCSLNIFKTTVLLYTHSLTLLAMVSRWDRVLPILGPDTTSIPLNQVLGKSLISGTYFSSVKYCGKTLKLLLGGLFVLDYWLSLDWVLNCMTCETKSYWILYPLCCLVYFIILSRSLKYLMCWNAARNM